MSEEKSYEMNENIGKRVKKYIIGYVLLILCIIWGDTIYGIVNKALFGSKDEVEFTAKVIETFLMLASSSIVFLLNLGRDMDIHNYIDKRIFKVRNKTGKIICNEMINAAKKVHATSVNEMGKNEDKVMGLFYHFVNEQEVLRGISFTYWEQYFVNIYNSAFACISFILSIILLIIRWKFDYMLLAPIFFLIIITLVGISTHSLVVNKIYKLPVSQIEEIRSSCTDEFIREIESRFKRNIIIIGGNDGRV